ncbi:MAG: TIGR02147 family protein [Bdellovibrionota bacterium]|nr:TIGR02147 family protein [Bdellovibrionota bacterium]
MEKGIFDFKICRKFLEYYIESLPKRGRGFPRKLAKAIDVSPVVISQVLSGARMFTTEQAFATADFLDLSPLEKDYFMAIVNKERAGTKALSQYYNEQASIALGKHSEIQNRIKNTKELDDNVKAIYYSEWYYSAIKLIVCNPEVNTAEDIAEVLPIPLQRIREVLQFLEEYQLIAKNGTSYSWKASSTHVPASSPLVNRHHQNWRVRAANNMLREKDNTEEIFFTSPMIIDGACAVKLRERILNFISSSQKLTTEAPSDKLFCLNIDLFEVKN